jgi:hypothetical protein
MKRLVVVGAMVVGLMLGAAPGASAFDDRGNHGPPWSLEFEGQPVHPGVDSGYEWGKHVSDVTPEYTNPNLNDGGPGISEGVHFLKGNGPDS